MMYIAIEEASVLIPNKDHMNFTESGEVIKKGAKLNGKIQMVDGLRRGKPFKYRLFKTDNNQLIHLNKVKPMETEVSLGADAAVTPTVIDVVSKKSFTKYTIGGAIIGAGAGFSFCKYKKYNTQKTAIITIISAIAGFAAGRYAEKSGVFIKTSK